MKEEGDFEIETDSDSTYSTFDFNTARRKDPCTDICQNVTRKKAINWQRW